MFDYDQLEVTGTFYIEFDNKDSTEDLVSLDIEDLIRYWYRSWFDKFTSPVITWINYGAINTNDVVKVQVNLSDCKSTHYIEKDFITATESINGDNRRSLHRILSTGVNNAKTKISKVNCDFVVTNTYTVKFDDIPNPYLIKDFSINQLSSKVTSNKELVDYINKLVTEEEIKWNKLIDELDTITKYQLMRKHLDKFEQLEIAVKALKKYLEM